MADESKGRLEKIGKLMVVLAELREKEQAVVEEIAELAGGGVGIGAKLKDLQAAWQRVWSERYKSPYAFVWAKDVALMKRLLKQFGQEDLDARMVRYLADEDPFYAKSRHPFGVFVSAVNRYAEAHPTGGTASWDRPLGCTCTPPCRTDQEHTQVRMRAMRQ